MTQRASGSTVSVYHADTYTDRLITDSVRKFATPLVPVWAHVPRLKYFPFDGRDGRDEGGEREREHDKLEFALNVCKTKPT